MTREQMIDESVRRFRDSMSPAPAILRLMRRDAFRGKSEAFFNREYPVTVETIRAQFRAIARMAR